MRTSIEPIRLVTDSAAATTAGISPWLLALAVALGLTLVALALGALIARRRSRASDPEGHAFLWLTRRLSLSAGHRQTLARLARAADAHPLTLLLSPAAFSSAATRLEAECADEGHPLTPEERSSLLEISSRVFQAA